jgi:hypothetical protein
MKTFKSQDLIKKLEFYFDHGKNVLLSGHKGVGKTAIITEVFNRKAKKWLYFSGSTLDPFVDFIGVPKEKITKTGSTLEFIRPSYMNDEVEAIFIDEYNRSVKKIRNAIMELIQFKSLNGQKFPNLKVIWAGVNPYNADDEDNEVYDVEPIDPAQKDRFQIQIDIPYAIDEEYFTNKFGQKWAEGTCEWWNNLPEKIKKLVSPRRIDYALEVYQIGGEVTDVLPVESNPSKLLASINFGGIEKVITDIFKSKDKKAALKFLENENYYQSCAHLVVQDRDWANFFFPLLDEERQVSLFFGNKKFQDIVFGDPIHYKPLLETAEHNKLCNDNLLRKIQHILKKMRGINLDDFGNTVDSGSYITSIGTGNVLTGNLNGFFNNNTSNISVTDNNIGAYSIAEIPKAKKAKPKKRII